MLMRVLAGVVLYNPPTSTCSLLESLKAQGCIVSIFVNALPEARDLSEYSKFSDFCSFLGENIGLANALNSIIKIFQSEDFDYLFLFDQDSQIAKDYIAKMINQYSAVAGYDNRIACLAPRLVDVKHSGVYASHKSLVNAVFHNKAILTAATSGCLFTQSSILRVGYMDHNLFIDGIDHDWCLRAWKKGASIHISCEIALLHDMGNAFIKFGSSLKPIHSSPIRHYYIVRNSVYMILWKSLPMSWNIREGFKTIRRVIGYPLLSRRSLLSLKMVVLGILHGILKRMGKLSLIDH